MNHMTDPVASAPPARLVLASSSPQRARLLEQLGLTFTAVAADIDETPRPDETPEALAERLAHMKAQALSIAYADARIIGSDTVVAVEGQIFGKPVDRADAARMLAALAGRTHRVLSGVAVSAGGVTTTRLCVSDVTMVPLTDHQIASYWDSGEPIGKAGGYAIQGIGAQFISALSGSYSGVMGLPLYETAQLLRDTGFDPLDRR
ncbi:MAG: Maf family protein [Salinisphaera sp.]|jgi:septum formation protein|nr:Maf family protein [Salinisphaera sp.]